MTNKERHFELVKAALTGLCGNQNFSKNSLPDIVGFAFDAADLAIGRLPEKDVEEEDS